MPRHIDSESRTDTVVGAINHVLATDGIAALTLRRIGRLSGVSPPSILQHYGNREHLIRVAAFRTAKARLRDIERRRDSEGILAFLPVDDDGIVEAREWLAWCELWRAEPSIAGAMSDAHDWERALLASTLDYGPAEGDDLLDRLAALIEGLRAGICRPERPLPLPRAREILRRDVAS
jgi:AcrR family transcriptional regulator